MAQSTTVISPDVARDLQQRIGDAQPKTMNPDQRQGYCRTWPAARTGLEDLRTVLSFVPGVTMFAALANSVVLAAGDATTGALCKPD